MASIQAWKGRRPHGQSPRGLYAGAAKSAPGSAAADGDSAAFSLVVDDPALHATGDDNDLARHVP